MRLALIVVFVAVLTASTTSESFDARVWKFQHHWDHFLRRFWGCSPADASRTACNPALSTIDRAEYDAARKAAIELFDLKEAKP